MPRAAGGTLLVLGADALRERAFAVWAREGRRILLADGVSAARYDHLADECFPLEVRDGEQVDLDRLVALARRSDGVTTLADASLATAARVAAEAGVPGPGLHAAEVSRSKEAQRRLALEHGIPSPRAAAVRTRDDIEAFFDGAPGPAVLKPTDAAGSTAVHLVVDEHEAQRLWPEVRTFSRSATGIVEDFVPGPEISVEATVRDGAVVAASVTRKETGGPTGFIEVQHTVRRNELPELVGLAERAIERLAAAWRVETAVMHVEYKVRPAELVLIEGAVRPGGDLIPDVLALARGRDLYGEQAALALGEELAARADGRAAFAAVRFLVATGTVRRFVPPASVLADLPLVDVANQLVQPGRRLREVLGNWNRAAYALGHGADLDDLQRSLVEALSRLERALGVRSF